MSDLLLRVIAATVVAACLVFFGTGLHPLWPCLWLAPIPLLLLAPRVSASVAFASAALAWFAGSFNMWRYVRNILGTSGRSIAIALVAMAIPSIAFGVCALLPRAFARRRRPFLAALSWPCAWVTYEYLTMVVSPHGTFGNIAYTQMKVLPLLQLASLTGVWGISFCVMLLSSTIAARDSKVARAAALFYVVVFTFGEWRLQAKSVAECARVGLMASDARENVLPQEPGADSARLYRQYIESAASLVREKPDVIVLPEKLGVAIDPATLRDDDAQFRAFANAAQSDVVVGMIRIARSNRYNEARVYSPRSDAALAYDKRHMLPAFESKFRPGSDLTVLQRRSGKWGVAICKDLDFPDLGRDYGAQRIGLLLVPAWDFDDDAWLHGRMAVMRGVESGFTIARAAKQGLLTVSDNRGRILVDESSNTAPFATLFAKAPVASADTLYRRSGDWFAWLCAAAVAWMLAALLRS